MGREQGDELGNEVVYTHPDHEGERRAYTAVDRVNLEARGWERQTETSGRKAKDNGNKGDGKAGAGAVVKTGESERA